MHFPIPEASKLPNMGSFVAFSRIFAFSLNTCAKKFNNQLLASQKSPVHRLWTQQTAGLYHFVPWIKRPSEYKQIEPDITQEDEKLVDNVITEINDQVATEKAGRLFAVVHICGKQFKVTTNDLIVVQGYWPPNIGDKLNLEKVLLLGSKDFTLIGRPILNRELVSVDATVIEKTLSTVKTHFKFKPRKQYRRINFYRAQFTILRINSIKVNGKVGEKKEVEGLDKVY